MLWAMQEPGLVKRRVGTILDDVVLRRRSAASSCGTEVKLSKVDLDRKGGGEFGGSSTDLAGTGVPMSSSGNKLP